MGVVIWVIAGAILGSTAHSVLGNCNRAGIALNVATGITGVLAGGWILGVLTGTSGFEPGDFSLASLLVSLMGATVLLAVLQIVRNARPGAAATPANRAFKPLEIVGRRNHFQHERTDMHELPDSRRALRPLFMAGLAGILMLVGACASPPLKPDSALDAARVAISNAEKAEAGQYASAELGEARERLSLADKAVQAEDMVAAERFARESQVEAELASARTALAKAAAVNRDIERGTDAMAEEMQRAGDTR